MNKKKIIIIAAVCIVLVAAVVAIAISVLPKDPNWNVARNPADNSVNGSEPLDDNHGESQQPGNDETDPTDQRAGYHEIQVGEDIGNIVVDVMQSPDYVEPGPGALDLDKIQGLVIPGGTAEGSNQESNGEGQQSTDTPKGTVLSDSNLTAEVVAQYAGSFLEDGSDAATGNVTAMVITNNSDQMLQVGIVTFQVNDTETAEFMVTDLPAGASALVMESNQRQFNPDDDFSYGQVATSYIDSPSLESDKFDILQEDGKLTLVNKTQQSYGQVYVYYKYVQLGGAYLGGITYRVPFNDVPANGQVESVAGHFRTGGSQIIAVVIMPEES